MNKECHECHIEKPEDQFSWKNKAAGKRMTRCKSCHGTYVKQHYIDNKSAYIARAVRDAKKNYDKIRELVLSLKVSCCECGETHPAMLDFHHTDPTQKDKAISSIHSKKKIIEEAKKCVVLCSNCHRKLHWDQQHDLMGN